MSAPDKPPHGWQEVPYVRAALPGSSPDAGGYLEEASLDPVDWAEARALAHAALDDALDSIQGIRSRPVWQSVPEEIKEEILEPLPQEPGGLAAAYAHFKRRIFPYPTGNIHPRFFGWVHGSGLVSGIVSEMMAAAMNANCGGRDHAAVYAERCVIDWCKQLFGYPRSASGILLSGTSMATMVGLAVARNSKANWDVRREGVAAGSARLTAYTSTEGHESIAKALELLGLGGECLRRIPVDGSFRMDLQALSAAIQKDRLEGFEPFCVIGTAGTVNTAAIDDLDAIASLCREANVWFHVDGAFAALCILSDILRPRLKGIERADSIAFDFHKWLHVPYEAGCVLVRNGEEHWKTFSTRPAYLAASERGLAGGGRWFCEFGPELSRGFRALKVWFAIKEHGARRFGERILQNCRQAEYLAGLVRRQPELELSAEPALNIVCFRYCRDGLPEPTLDYWNREIVADLQERGIAAPSTTRVAGKLVIRVNITNHRTRQADLDLLVREVVSIGNERLLMAE